MTTKSEQAEEQFSEAHDRTTLSRRGFLGALGVATVGLAGCGTTGAVTPKVPDNDLLDGDALDQAARIRSGQTTAQEMVEATIERIEALNGPVNAVVTTFYERALTRAAGPLPEGPFQGVPFLLKDLNDLEGTPTSMGSHLFDGYVAEKSSPHAEAVEAAGLLVLGKTNTPEFGLVATTESAKLGPCRNPWNLDYSAGGSSGGAGAAIAAGLMPMTQGSDGGGSIRIPASCNGVFGLKPSRGRNIAAPQTRAIDISVKHSLSRSVRDTAAYSTVVQRTDAAAPFAPLPFVEGPSERRLKIGFFTKNALGEEAHPEVKRCQEEAAALCEGLGHEIAPTDFDLEGEALFEHFLNLWASIPAGLVETARSRGLDPVEVLEPVSLGLADRFARTQEGALPAAVSFFEGYTARIDERLSAFDVLLCPVLRDPPPLLGTYAGTLPYEEVFEPMVGYVGYTPAWNATGHPGMSVPLGWSMDGLPIGSQFIARHGDEQTLLELAYELEIARPWADRRPD